MLTHFKIDYSRWSTDDTSPINDDIKVKTSHAKLVSQSENSDKAKEWRKNNKNKASSIASIGGIQSVKLKKGIHKRTKDEMSNHSKNLYKEGKGFAKVTKKERSNIGKTIGKLNLCNEIICEKCGKIVNKGNYSKSHGTKCRENEKIALVKLLPNKFTKSILKEIALENGIKDWEKLNLLHDSCPYTKCIKKVEKPNQYNPCWYSKK